MARAITGRIHLKRRRKVLKDVRGFRGARSKLFRTAKDARRRALQNSYRHRRMKKRDFRSLWIMRINAATRSCGMSYSKFMGALRAGNIVINRKMLAEMAVKDMDAFRKLVDQVNKKAA
jgi:large subunit ribosomal protein L20